MMIQVKSRDTRRPELPKRRTGCFRQSNWLKVGLAPSVSGSEDHPQRESAMGDFLSTSRDEEKKV